MTPLSFVCRYPVRVTIPALTLAEQSVDARGGRELLQWQQTGGLSRTVSDVRTLKKGGDGSVVVPNVDVLKTGFFNGYLSIVDGDLLSMVERFDMLLESGTFLPPFRIDHSMSMTKVVGWFDALRTYQRVDETDGLTKTFLQADVRITGSLDYSVDQVIDAIARGALRTRSSELGPYMTNAGLELPMIFYGCAFVDIPAVEGLGDVKLDKHPEPGSITKLTISTDTTEDGAMPDLDTSTDDTTDDDSTDTSADDADTTTDDGDDTSGDDTSGAGDTDGDQDGDDAAGADDTVTDGGDGDDDTGPSAELASLRAENRRLRTERANDQLSAYQASGRVTQATLQQARLLLQHSDDTVVTAFRHVLDQHTPPVTLGRGNGNRTNGTSGGDNGSTLFPLDMSTDEAGDLWSGLTRDERKAHQLEYNAWFKHGSEHGFND